MRPQITFGELCRPFRGRCQSGVEPDRRGTGWPAIRTDGEDRGRVSGSDVAQPAARSLPFPSGREPAYVALDVETANPGWASILPDAPGPPPPRLHDTERVFRQSRASTTADRTAVGPSPANPRDFAYPYIACGRKVASPGRSPMSNRSASIASQKGMIPR